MSLERLRLLLSERELLVKGMYTTLGDPSLRNAPKHHEINAHQNVKLFFDQFALKTRQLRDMQAEYTAQQPPRAEEMDTLQSFQADVDQLAAYCRKNPLTARSETYEESFLRDIVQSTGKADFSGEEAKGRYVDMHLLHEEYLNLKNIERVGYTAYLKLAPRLTEVPQATARSASYAKYLTALFEYWRGFLRRAQPLLQLDELLDESLANFSERWARCEIVRWQSPKDTLPEGGTDSHIDLDLYQAAEQLEALGLETLKAELIRLGLKCGGSLQERAHRLFAVKGLEPSAIPKSLLSKGPRPQGTNAADRFRSIALQEEQTMQLGALLAETLDATTEMIEKKQARTYEEIERDLAASDEEQSHEESGLDDDEDRKPIYNPRNLPLGWDDKPIPYWLYKLHGLNLQFKCEICSNTSYWGPRAFERHFSEAKHAHGMSCLGIPNSKAFHGVTLIEDAYTLWEKMKADSAGSKWNADVDEEFEDRSGNVMNRRTYTDLARQGLL